MSRNDERLIKGPAYIARIKDSRDDSNIHRKRDFLHVVAYDDPAEGFDYMKLKNLVDNMNEGVILYSKVVNRKSRASFSWNQCLDELMGQPSIGDTCLTVHDRPITLGQMAKLAYDHHILQDSAGFNYLNSKLAPPPLCHLLMILRLFFLLLLGLLPQEPRVFQLILILMP